jgi:hypothetical protein
MGASQAWEFIQQHTVGVVIFVAVVIALLFLHHGRMLLALLAAAYLALTAVIAVPSFREEAVNINKQLDDLREALKRERDEIGKLEATLPSKDWRDRLEKVATSNLPNVAQSARMLLVFYRDAALHTPEFLDGWANALEIAIQQKFATENRGRIGLRSTERHRDELVLQFHNLIVQVKSGSQFCDGLMDDTLTELEARAKQQTAIGTATASSSPRDDVVADRLANLQQKCILYSPVNMALPERGRLEDSLGIFGSAAAWLLRTENPDLALITGLIGFGLLGALGASFIRSVPGGDTASRDLVPIFVRGTTAAFLVFLVVMGGIAIFTNSDPKPNAYAVFFTCFVAAVFSEDVWAWARTTQEQRLRQAAVAGAAAGREAVAQAGVATSDTHGGAATAAADAHGVVAAIPPPPERHG